MIRELIALEDEARVWIYQADKFLTEEETVYARRQLHQFMKNWTSHNNELLTYGNIFHRRFLALFVDESMAHTSGCSIDSSVAFVKSLGTELNVDFFDRMNYAYFENVEEKHIKMIAHQDLSDHYNQGKINDDTLFIDNLVKTKGEFLTQWVKPLKESWHHRFVS